MNNHTVFKFTMFFDGDFRPEDRQERYVVAKTEAEAIDKFNKYLQHQADAGFAKPAAYSYYPTVEIDYVIV